MAHIRPMRNSSVSESLGDTYLMVFDAAEQNRCEAKGRVEAMPSSLPLFPNSDTCLENHSPHANMADGREAGGSHGERGSAAPPIGITKGSLDSYGIPSQRNMAHNDAQTSFPWRAILLLQITATLAGVLAPCHTESGRDHLQMRVITWAPVRIRRRRCRTRRWEKSKSSMLLCTIVNDGGGLGDLPRKASRMNPASGKCRRRTRARLWRLAIAMAALLIVCGPLASEDGPRKGEPHHEVGTRSCGEKEYSSLSIPSNDSDGLHRGTGLERLTRVDERVHAPPTPTRTAIRAAPTMDACG